ncbi:MAG: carboxypeptidase M32 [Deltaproteobacteria bacterium]|nr:carboxypeptidase M32 [Deltaproteobacteria bacterium]
MNALVELKSELRAISDLNAAAMVLEWDQNTYMPPGGADARGRQIALLSRLAHERRSAKRMGELLSELSAMADAESVDGALVRRALRDYQRATKVPAELMEAISNHGSVLYSAWAAARKANDFEAVRPLLEKNLELSKRYAEHFEVDHPIDAFVDEHDPGMTAASLKTLFSSLRADLVPIVEALLARPEPDRSFLDADYPEEKQLAFAAEVSAALGYDFQRGRQDLTHHPFMIRFSSGDVRITTRVDPRDFTDCLFGTIHETGHALYEQNIDRAFDGTPLGAGTSTGVHESQSRLWENLVGRSRPFWEHMYPKLQATFPEPLADVSLDDFHRAINTVERGLVRVDSDEVTYNLHVMLRFDLECAMLEGELAIRDLPEAWNARMEADLGTKPPTDTLGCLQDVHWYCIPIGGAFQGYTLGNLMSAQFFGAASKALPELDAQLAKGEVGPLRSWLTENIYRHGATYFPDELIQRTTGAALSPEPFLAYLRKKYGPLYDVEL